MGMKDVAEVLINDRITMFKISEHMCVFVRGGKIFSMFRCGERIYNQRVINIKEEHDTNTEDWTEAVMQ